MCVCVCPHPWFGKAGCHRIWARECCPLLSTAAAGCSKPPPRLSGGAPNRASGRAKLAAQSTWCRRGRPGLPTPVGAPGRWPNLGEARRGALKRRLLEDTGKDWRAVGGGRPGEGGAETKAAGHRQTSRPTPGGQPPPPTRLTLCSAEQGKRSTSEDRRGLVGKRRQRARSPPGAPREVRPATPTCGTEGDKCLRVLADDLLVDLGHGHLGEEVLNEIVGSHGRQVPLELVH